MNHGLRNIVAGYYGLVLRVTNRVNAGGYPGYPDQGPVTRCPHNSRQHFAKIAFYFFFPDPNVGCQPAVTPFWPVLPLSS
jgi:hypothetical protein